MIAFVVTTVDVVLRFLVIVANVYELYVYEYENTGERNYLLYWTVHLSIKTLDMNIHRKSNTSV
jgi:hypothetical protein